MLENKDFDFNCEGIKNTTGICVVVYPFIINIQFKLFYTSHFFLCVIALSPRLFLLEHYEFKLEEYCQKKGKSEVDAILVPWVSLSGVTD
jgi:hypothetical protein